MAAGWRPTGLRCSLLLRRTPNRNRKCSLGHKSPQLFELRSDAHADSRLNGEVSASGKVLPGVARVLSTIGAGRLGVINAVHCLSQDRNLRSLGSGCKVVAA